MATKQLKLGSNLVLKVKTEVDQKGNDVFRNITLKKVKASASDQDLFDTAKAIEGLLKHGINSIAKQDTNEIVAI